MSAEPVNLEKVSKSYGVRPLLTEVSLGIGSSDRIGVVGRNGDGKTTLLRVMTGLEEPDSGRVSQQRGLLVGVPGPGRRAARQPHRRARPCSAAAPTTSGRPTRCCARSSAELLAGVELDRAVLGLLRRGAPSLRAGGAAARRPRSSSSLDEPTNHLDVEAVAWLADHLRRRSGALVVVTHDRWFLDEVCEWTWEVHDGAVDVYDGGYAAFVLAKAERRARPPPRSRGARTS